MPGGTVYVVNEAYGYYMFSIVKGVTVVVHSFNLQTFTKEKRVWIFADSAV